MTSNFEDQICELVSKRLKQCLPLGLYKIWFRVKEGNLEGLGNLLGYSNEDFIDLVKYSALSRRNGRLDMDLWEKKLHIKVESRRFSIGKDTFTTVRFGEPIAIGNSPPQFSLSDTRDDIECWSSKTFKDSIFRETYIQEYRRNFEQKFADRRFF